MSRSKTESMERRRHKFDPPSGVVGPALAELFVRLRTAQGGPTGGALEDGLSTSEKEIFEYGKSARKSVIESTCLLIFAQWAVHRGAIRRLNRFARLTYSTSCFVGTFAYVQSRARAASTEMFARFVTLPTDSAVANEARVILAELEGPNGPYFTEICSERGFAEDLYFATNESGDSSIHPQLRLQPRLGGRMSRPRRNRGLAAAINGNNKNGINSDGTGDGGEDDLDSHILIRRKYDSSGGSRGTIGNQDTNGGRPPPPPWARGRREKKWAESQPVETQWGVERFESKPSDNDFVDLTDFDDSATTKAFDFASAARGMDDMKDDDDSDADLGSGAMSPSQRRAHERRERRRIARERAESRW